MHETQDLAITLKSHFPVIVVESREEIRILNLFKRISLQENYPLFSWSVTDGLQNHSGELSFIDQQLDPVAILKHIKAQTSEGIYILNDYHPYLDDPIKIRLIKEIAQSHTQCKRTLVLVSHELPLPNELKEFGTFFSPSIPGQTDLQKIVEEVANDWCSRNHGKKVQTDETLLNLLVKSLVGLTTEDAKRLARAAIFDDGAISESDIKEVMSARYNLIKNNGALSFEYDTTTFEQVAGLKGLKKWLEERKVLFEGKPNIWKLEPPKGIILLGVQGCGKSMAAKAVAGSWHVPLLRFDFGSLYNKFIGESEKTLRESLQAAETLAPCVLWIDEIEKGIGSSDADGGTSRRVLGTLLTWMSEKKAPVFIVATANDITTLPPELIRKGRFDEIFFIDLPDFETRKALFTIHLEKRDLTSDKFDVEQLADAAKGFAGGEIEQAIVSALYTALAAKEMINTGHILNELGSTKPLSIIMAEDIEQLRSWANERTVTAN